MRGINFTQAYAATPTCVPARATISPASTSAIPALSATTTASTGSTTARCPALLAEAGYHTQCVGKMHTHPSRNLDGFPQCRSARRLPAPRTFQAGRLRAGRRLHAVAARAARPAGRLHRHRRRLQRLRRASLGLRRDAAPDQLGHHHGHRLSAPPRSD